MTKRVLGILAALAIVAIAGPTFVPRAASGQGTPISGLPAAPSPIPSDVVPATMTRSGVKATYALSLAQIQALFFSGTTVYPSKGQATCTMSAATNCTATATVLAGGTCTASYDAATTASATTLLPLTVSVSTTTLSIEGRVSGSAVSTAFTFDFLCL
jgi:hypothetical protein